MISTAEAAWELVKRSIRVPEGGWWNKGTQPTTAGLILPMPWVDAEQCFQCLVRHHRGDHHVLRQGPQEAP